MLHLKTPKKRIANWINRISFVSIVLMLVMICSHTDADNVN